MSYLPSSSVLPIRSWRRCVGIGLCGLVLALGCSSFTSNDRLLADSTFTSVLMELHLAEARRTLDRPLPPGLRDSIFARYGVRQSEFEATLKYYSQRPKVFGALYQTVIDSLRASRHTPGARSGNPSQRMPDSLSTTPNRRPQGP